MKIATWNVNSIRTRLEQVTHWLTENPVHVLCLQETKVVDGDFPRSPFEEMGYQCYIAGQKSYNGVALISRSPLTSVSIGFAPILNPDLHNNLDNNIGDNSTGDLDDQKRVISGLVADVRIVNLYVPNGSEVGSEKYQYKLKWLACLRDYLKTLLAVNEPAEAAICICGDFNIALDDRDIYDPKGKENHIMASESERLALRSILDLGFQDAFRKFTTEGGHFTWWDYRTGGFQRNRGWRIDHLYLTTNLYDRALACTIDKAPRQLTKPSDHTPVILELNPPC